MSDETEIEVVVEADASAVVNTTAEAATAFSKLLEQIKQLETGLAEVFTKQLPMGVAEIKKLADAMREVQRIPVLPDRVVGVNQTRSAGGGGPGMSAAAVRSTTRELRDDPAILALKHEAEINKVVEAREQLYRRVRAAMPDATEMQALTAYRQLLTSLGANPASKDGLGSANMSEADITAARTRRQKFFAETETETTAFNTKMQAEYLAEEAAKYEKANVLYEQMMRRRAATMSPQQAEERLQRISQFGAQRGIQVDQERLRSAYADERARYTAINGSPEQAMSDQAEQRIKQRLAMRQAQMDYQGGAPMFGVEAHTLANYALMGAGIGGAAYAGKSVLDFQNGLDGIKADAGVTDTEMARLAHDIMAVGTSSSQSFKDLTDATELLVKAGYSVQQAGEMLKPVSQLATATKSTAKDAADVTTEVMKTFDIAASQAPMVTNALAEISIKSKLSLADMRTAFKDAGQFAKGAGMQFNEVLAAFGAMAAAGMKDGAQMGSGLKSLIEGLDNPSTKLQAQLAKVGLTAADVNVQTNGLGGALENMQIHGFTAADAMAGLQARSFGVYEALSKNVDVYKQLEGSVLTSTAAVDGSTVRVESLEVQWHRFLNTITKVAFEGGAPLLRMLAGMLSGLTAVLGVASKASPVIGLVGTVLGAMAASAILVWLGKLAAGFLMVGDVAGMATLKLAATAVAEEEFSMAAGLATVAAREMAVAFLATPLGWLTLGITALSLGLGAFSAIQNRASEEVSKYSQAAADATAKQQEYQTRIQDIDTYIASLIERHASLSKNTSLAASAAEIATQKFGSWSDQIKLNTRDVDTLISRLIELRRQQAAAGLEAAKTENTSLGNENRALTGQMSGPLDDASNSAHVLAGRAGLFNQLNSNARSAIQQISRGAVTADQIQPLLAALRSDSSANQPGSYVGSIIDSLNRAAPTAAKIATNSAKIQTNDQTVIAPSTVQSNPQYASVMDQITKLAIQQRDEEAKASLVKDPLQRAQAQQQAFKDRDARAIQAQQLAQSAAAKINTDPQVQGTAMQTIARDQTYQSLQAGSMNGTPNDEKSWSARAQRLRAQASLAKKQGDMGSFKSLSDQATHADLEAKAASPNFDAASSVLDDTQAKDDAKTTGAETSGVNKALSRRGEAYSNQADTILTQVKELAGQGDDKNDGTISAQLAKYSQLMQQAARLKAQASGDTPAEIKDAVDRAAAAAQKTTTELLASNMALAKKAVLEQAQNKAKSTTDMLTVQQEDNEGPGLEKSIAEVKGVFQNLLVAQIDSIKADYMKEHPGATGLPPEVKAKIDKAKSDVGVQQVTAVLSVIDATAKGLNDAVTEALDAARNQQGGQRAVLQASKNEYNSPRLGETHQYMIGHAENQLDITSAKNEQQAALANQKTAQDRYNQIEAQREALDPNLPADDPQLLKLNTAKDAAQKGLDAANTTASQANAKVTELTASVQPLASASQAVAAAWEKFGQSQAIVEPFWEQFADGASSVLNNLNNSFGKFFSSLASGTEKPKKAFQQLGLSIFQSLEEAASKMLANAVIKEIFAIGTSMIGGSPAAGGGGSGVGFGSLRGGMWQGGYVRRAQGGIMTGGIPTRDSIPTLTAPGEFVLNQDAVSMIGKDTLDNINSAGNHVRTNTPTIAQAIPKREPDLVNVNVVAPEAKPQLGKKDIIAAITDDMLTNGQTKKLVQQVALGNL